MHSSLTGLSVPLVGFFVWIHMLPGDNLESARQAAAALPHPRARHFHDPRRRAGKAVGRSVESGGAVVWDTYLLFTEAVTWGESPPAPMDWAHQLSAGWADPQRLRRAEELPAWLEDALGNAPASLRKPAV